MTSDLDHRLAIDREIERREQLTMASLCIANKYTTLNKENFAVTIALFAIIEPHADVGSIVIAWMHMVYPGVIPNDMLCLYSYAAQCSYSIEMFKDKEWVQNFFDWLEPQTTATFDTIKAIYNG